MNRLRAGGRGRWGGRLLIGLGVVAVGTAAVAARHRADDPWFPIFWQGQARFVDAVDNGDGTHTLAFPDGRTMIVHTVQGEENVGGGTDDDEVAATLTITADSEDAGDDGQGNERADLPAWFVMPGEGTSDAAPAAPAVPGPR